MKVGVIITAGGRSERYSAEMGFSRSKLEEDIHGRPVLMRAIEPFTKCDSVGAIVVAGPADDGAFADFRSRFGDRFGLLGVRLCRGGAAHRYETVRAALAHVPDDCTHIAVHDGARPCVRLEMVQRVFDALVYCDAVVPGIRVSETLKRVAETASTDAPDPAEVILGLAQSARVRTVRETVCREHMFLVQTPQAFSAGVLRRAYAQTDLTSTDDAALVERLGESVRVVDGDPQNIKITTPADMELARLYVRNTVF